MPGPGGGSYGSGFSVGPRGSGSLLESLVSGENSALGDMQMSVPNQNAVSNSGVSTNPYAYADYIMGLEQKAADQQYQNELNSAKLAMNFEASEAEKLRNWQLDLRNSAMQASVADMKKAGLNPALAIGSPAATPAGASAGGHTASSAKANMNTGANVALSLRELAINSAVKVAQSTMSMIGDIIPG